MSEEYLLIGEAIMRPEVRSGDRWILALPHECAQIRFVDGEAEIRIRLGDSDEWLKWQGRQAMDEFRLSVRDLDTACRLISPLNG